MYNRQNLRVGSLVKCTSVSSPNYGLAGKIVKCHVPGGTCSSGTAGFKYVDWRDGRAIVRRGEFTQHLQRITWVEFGQLIDAACQGRPK